VQTDEEKMNSNTATSLSEIFGNTLQGPVWLLKIAMASVCMSIAMPEMPDAVPAGSYIFYPCSESRFCGNRDTVDSTFERIDAWQLSALTEG
jgi:hypothetical protein